MEDGRAKTLKVLGRTGSHGAWEIDGRRSWRRQERRESR